MAAFHATGDRAGARDPKDRYETPDDVVEALMRRFGHFFEGHESFDPCCGTGRVVRCLRRLGYDAVGTDLEEDEQDFLSEDYQPDGRTDLPMACVTNPPYSLAREFVEKAIATYDGPVAMLLPQDFLGSAGRRDWLHGPGRPMWILNVPWRIKFYRRDGTEIAGQAYSHQWVLWPAAGYRPARDTRYDWASLTPERAARVACGSGQYNRAGKQMWGRLNERRSAGDAPAGQDGG